MNNKIFENSKFHTYSDEDKEDWYCYSVTSKKYIRAEHIILKSIVLLYIKQFLDLLDNSPKVDYIFYLMAIMIGYGL